MRLKAVSNWVISVFIACTAGVAVVLANDEDVRAVVRQLRDAFNADEDNSKLFEPLIAAKYSDIISSAKTTKFGVEADYNGYLRKLTLPMIVRSVIQGCVVSQAFIVSIKEGFGSGIMSVNDVKRWNDVRRKLEYTEACIPNIDGVPKLLQAAQELVEETVKAELAKINEANGKDGAKSKYIQKLPKSMVKAADKLGDLFKPK